MLYLVLLNLRVDHGVTLIKKWLVRTVHALAKVNFDLCLACPSVLRKRCCINSFFEALRAN